jgi:hypothetical protein
MYNIEKESMDNSGERTFFHYLPYSDEDERWEMVCTDAGYTEVPPYTIYPPNKEGHPRMFQRVAVGRTLNEYQIIYVTKAKAFLEPWAGATRSSPDPSSRISPESNTSTTGL